MNWLVKKLKCWLGEHHGLYQKRQNRWYCKVCHERVLFSILVGVLLAGEVGAEVIQSVTHAGKACRQTNINEWNCDEIIVTQDKEHACLAKMREAMRSMEESLKLESNQKDRKQPVWMIPELLKPSNWNRVMKECMTP